MPQPLRSLLVAGAVLSIGAHAQAAPLPNFTHVYIIVMENHEFSDIIGNPSAPYINGLAGQYALGTAYTALTHPSLPNYMSLTGGNLFFTDDCIGCTVNAASVVDQIEASGRRWKAYMEDMAAPCTTDDNGPGQYTVHHNPFVHYNNIVNNASRCQSSVVPLSALGADLIAGTVPDYVWITPNLCSDMHDCSVATGDEWLQIVVPYILDTPDFATSVLFLVWDEGTSNIGGGGRVPMLVVSPLVQPGFQSTAAQNHYSLLRTIQDAWGLGPLAQTSTALAMTEYFKPLTSGVPGVPGAPTNLVGASAGSSITLSWQAPTSGGAPTSYFLEGGSAPGLSDLGGAPTGSVATTLSIANVPDGTYYLRIRGQNGAGLGAPSNEIALVVSALGSPTVGAARDLLAWPFSPDSIWNMPIGSGAVYQSTGLSPASELFGDIDYFYVLKASDPLTPLYNDESVWIGPRCSSARPSGVSLNIPSALIVPDTSGSNTPNNAAAFLLPNGHTLEQVNALARCMAGGPVFGVPSEQNGGNIEDLYGSGITGGHAGSNLSSIGGTIRVGELTGAGAIRHALKVEVDGRYLYYSSQIPGFRWPANTADSCAPQCYKGKIPGMVQGSLLAIPPGATEQTLGLTTVPGRKLFHALQDYGAYMVDNSADISYNLAVESGVKSEFRTAYGYDFDASASSPWLSDIKAIFGSLMIVGNNGPASVGGGGVPRAILAPAVNGAASAGTSSTFSATSTTISPGGSTVLTWVVSGGTVAIDQGIGSVSLTGSRTVSPPATTTYTLSTSTASGAATRTVTIAVQ
jgi:hypothetical protein